MKFIKEFDKEAGKMEDVSSNSKPPSFYYHYGNYVLNRLMTGSFFRGVPQGRITAVAGPSHAGKSFIVGNLIREVQKENGWVLVLDSENALDDDYITNVGGDPSDELYNYKSVLTIPDTTKLVNSFLKGYKAEYGEDPEAPRGLIVIDSLDSLFTHSDWEAFQKKGELKADQGLQTKQLKGMLMKFQQAAKSLNVAMVVTKQVYRAKQEQLLQGEGIWVVNDAIRYPCSQILLVSRLKLKDNERSVTGIRMKCEGFKTRFTKPFQTATIEVPYDTGMDPYSGLFDVALELGVVEKRSGAYYSVAGEDEKWFAKNFSQRAEKVLHLCEQKGSKFLDAHVDDSEIEIPNDESARTKKVKRLQENDNDE